MLPSRASDSSKHDERVLCRNERKVESFPDLCVGCVVCGCIDGIDGVVWVCYVGD